MCYTNTRFFYCYICCYLYLKVFYTKRLLFYIPNEMAEPLFMFQEHLQIDHQLGEVSACKDKKADLILSPVRSNRVCQVKTAWNYPVVHCCYR